MSNDSGPTSRVWAELTPKTYTLAEAARELAHRECVTRGHDFTFMELRLTDEAPTGIVCTRCGWTGDVTMGEKP